VAVPNAEEARRILAARRLPDGIVEHSEGVARVAKEAARRLAESGIPIDVGLVEVAALLHDIDKLETRGGRGVHGLTGAAMLETMGFGELAPAVAGHPVSALLDDRRFPRGWPSVVVSVADKHVAQNFLTIDERLDDMSERYPQYRAEINAARRPAHALEQELADAIGVPVEDLVDGLRLAWQAAAPERAGR
jgi:putative nucleotidyltransferase with HDIG domain